MNVDYENWTNAIIEELTGGMNITVQQAHEMMTNTQPFVMCAWIRELTPYDAARYIDRKNAATKTLNVCLN